MFGFQAWDLVHTCYNCIASKGMDEKCIVLHTRKPVDILDRVFIDVMGPMPNKTGYYEEDNRYILTIMDDCSRIIGKFQDHWISIFGTPKELDRKSVV